jgi:hypothetical protein
MQTARMAHSPHHNRAFASLRMMGVVDYDV